MLILMMNQINRNKEEMQLLMMIAVVMNITLAKIRRENKLMEMEKVIMQSHLEEEVDHH